MVSERQQPERTPHNIPNLDPRVIRIAKHHYPDLYAQFEKDRNRLVGSSRNKIKQIMSLAFDESQSLGIQETPADLEDQMMESEEYAPDTIEALEWLIDDIVDDKAGVTFIQELGFNRLHLPKEWIQSRQYLSETIPDSIKSVSGSVDTSEYKEAALELEKDHLEIIIRSQLFKLCDKSVLGKVLDAISPKHWVATIPSLMRFLDDAQYRGMDLKRLGIQDSYAELKTKILTGQEIEFIDMKGFKIKAPIPLTDKNLDIKGWQKMNNNKILELLDEAEQEQVNLSEIGISEDYAAIRQKVMNGQDITPILPSLGKIDVVGSQIPNPIPENIVQMKTPRETVAKAA